MSFGYTDYTDVVVFVDPVAVKENPDKMSPYENQTFSLRIIESRSTIKN